MYYFYDPNYEKPKQVIIKGTNEYKTLENRKDVTVCILKKELHELINLGYNPFLKKYLKPIVKVDLHPDLCIMETFRLAHTKLKCSNKHLSEIRFAINRLEKSVKHLSLIDLKIKDVRKKHD